MNGSAVITIFLGTLLSLNPAISTSTEENESLYNSNNLEHVYGLTTSVTDDVKESILTIKLKCRESRNDTLSCVLEDPQYHTIYHISPCNKTIQPLCDKDLIRADNSYTGNFKIRYRSSCVDKLITGWPITFKQLNVYRTVADLLFPGVDVSDKPEGTYSLVEESVYGKCEALVKVVRTRLMTDESRKGEHKRDNPYAKTAFFPRDENSNTEQIGDHDRTKNFNAMLSIKRTRNLDTCHPIPGRLIANNFFYHPMMTTVHYAIKSSISRTIVRDGAFTSYTTEDIAMRNIEDPDGNTTMLHVRTTLILHSIGMVDKSFHESLDNGLHLVHNLSFHSNFLST